MNTHHRAPAFQLYPRDELSELYGVSIAAHGLFSRLRCHCWERGRLPSTPAVLARLANVPIARFRQLWPEIRDQFTRRGGALTLPALVDQQRAHEEHRLERSASGAIGAAVRWKNHRTKKPRDAYRVIVRLAHEVLNDPAVLEKTRGDFLSVFEFLKVRCAQLGIAYNEPPGVARRALEAARFQLKSQLRKRG